MKKKKLRIVHIEDRFHPLMGYQINFLAKYHSDDFEFHIITSNSLSIWEKEKGEINIKELDNQFEKEYNVKIHRLKAKWGESQKSNIWLKGLYKKVNQLNPDIIFIHVVESYSAIRILLNLYLRNKKVNVFTDTHTLYNQFYNSFKFKIHLLFIRTVLKRIIDKKKITVFATATENKEILIKDYKIPESNIQYLPIGTDTSHFYYSESDKQDLRTAFNAQPSDVILLYTGKINERKEPHLILEAIKTINHKIATKLHVVFIGPRIEPYFSRSFNMDYFKNKNNIQITFINSIENSLLYKYYSMADFAVFPKENTLSALDSQACKLPVIMESNTTNIERLEKGGIIYEKDNIHELGEKILELIDNSKLRSKLSKEGYKFIIDNYDYKSIIRNYEQLLLKYIA